MTKKVSQNRDAPAFQEYAASMMARIEYRTMTLQDRGLLYSMKLECWVNKQLPKLPDKLARVLGFDVAEVAASLPGVMPFFAYSGDFIVSPELDSYRDYLENQRERMSAGGKQGAERKQTANAKVRKALSRKEVKKGRPPRRPPCRGMFGVLVQQSKAKQRQVKPSH
jgi:hypothetical protein